MAKQKFYVVWQGVTPGIYHSWDECKVQTVGFENARYKSFSTEEEARKAFSENPWKHLSNGKKKPSIFSSTANIIKDSLSVDAACSGNPGKMEYRGVYVGNNAEVFRSPVLEDGTNNIGEFLALVHGLALLKQKKSEIPIYTDSINAIKWVEKKKCNTKLEHTECNDEIFDLIARAEKWLQENKYSTRILKWETEHWGEIPADFGRK
ncbi:MAG: ribonuclease H family protein [Dysgonamonadaceae bacterium]|jgi:ribonuclease HI|nr:ribonuclease H family protein [Dysgonamonadaceae bacterium]